MRVLIIGGYGTFGGRLADLFTPGPTLSMPPDAQLTHPAPDPRLTLIIAGRSLDKARAFCGGRAGLEPAAFDRDGDLDAQLAALKPDIVVDASGPFQTYGYAVVEACLRTGVHYLDLADATEFVDGIARFDAQAKAKGLVILSGVSTFPVLTGAAIRKLGGPGTEVAAGIAPSAHVDVGINVIRVIAGYAGKRAGDGYALMSSRRFVVAPPGRVPLKPTRFTLVDVPDLKLLPKLYPEVRSVWMGAGPQPAFWHRCLSLLAWTVRLRLLPSLSFLAPIMQWVMRHLRWGEHRGGFFLQSGGRSWHLIAEENEGALIPSMAAYAILIKWLDGNAPAPGARACTSDLEIEDYERVFRGRAIFTGVREPVDAAWPLYRRYLGSAWDALPAPIRDMHDGAGTWVAQGRADIDRGSSPLARLAAFVNGFPKAGRDVAVSVRFEERGGCETWTRTFAGKSFSSVQYEGRGRDERLIVERFGPLAFAMAMVVADGRMQLVVRNWSLLGMPLPRFLLPVGNTFESAEGGRFNFHVEIGFKWTGLIVRYRGFLERTP